MDNEYQILDMDFSIRDDGVYLVVSAMAETVNKAFVSVCRKTIGNCDNATKRIITRYYFVVKKIKLLMKSGLVIG